MHTHMQVHTTEAELSPDPWLVVLGVAHMTVLTSCLACLRPGIESTWHWDPERGYKHPLLQGGSEAPPQTSSQSLQAGTEGQLLPSVL